MRLTITRKIAAAVIGIVVLCIGTMVWLSAQNLQRGFQHYLNEIEGAQLDEMAGILRDAWREQGDLESIRHNPPALRALILRMRPAFQEEMQPRRPPRRREDGPPRRDYPQDAPPGRPDDRPAPPPPAADPLQEGQGMNERRGDPDPWGFGRRLSMDDDRGKPLFGPPDSPAHLTRRIEVDGRYIGTLKLAPMRAKLQASETTFLKGQLRDMLLLGTVLVLAAAAVAIWLARHLLRPVAGLRDVTQRIAAGQLAARAPVLGRDELAELAAHVNAMAAALEQNEQQRRRMLADVSHELRTPLTVVRGELEALLDGIRNADRSALESLHAEVLRLNKLVDDLYQLALADAGDLHYQFQALSLAGVLRPLAERYGARAADLKLALSITLPPADLQVRGDAGRLAQLFSNLLENSLRYTDGGGRLRLSLAREGAMALVALDDSAPGVPDEALGRLFERLYRADQARSRSKGGSGLGLAICKSIAEAHGGSIRALPSTLGGVRIEVRLPLLD